MHHYGNQDGRRHDDVMHYHGNDNMCAIRSTAFGMFLNIFDVITSLVSLEHGVYSWENVTSE
jgi:hypothetical protein